MICIILALTLIIDFWVGKYLCSILEKSSPEKFNRKQKYFFTLLLGGVLLIPCYFLAMLIVAIFATSFFPVD